MCIRDRCESEIPARIWVDFVPPDPVREASGEGGRISRKVGNRGTAGGAGPPSHRTDVNAVSVASQGWVNYTSQTLYLRGRSPSHKSINTIQLSLESVGEAEGRTKHVPTIQFSPLFSYPALKTEERREAAFFRLVYFRLECRVAG